MGKNIASCKYGQKKVGILAIQKVLLLKSVKLNPVCSANTIFSQQKK